MDETPSLARHPLHVVHTFKAKLPEAVATDREDNREVVESDGSETEGVSEEEEVREDNGSAWNEEEDDMPSTQLVDPRPLAGMWSFISMVCVCVCVCI